MHGETIAILRKKFNEKLEKKTGWGKNEIREVFNDCVFEMMQEEITASIKTSHEQEDLPINTEKITCYKFYTVGGELVAVAFTDKWANMIADTLRSSK